MEQEDDEFEKLLWEIQTPPQVEELHTGVGSLFEEIDSSEFYLTSPGKTTAIQKAPSPTFYSTFRRRHLELQEKQSQSFLESKHQLRKDDEFLSSAFGNLNFDDTPNSEANSHKYPENGSNNSHLDNSIAVDLPNGGSQAISSSGFSHMNVTEGFSDSSRILTSTSAAVSPLDRFPKRLSLARETLNVESSTGLNGVCPVPGSEPARSLQESYGQCVSSPHPVQEEQQTNFAAIAKTFPLQSWHQYPQEGLSATNMRTSPLQFKFPSVMQPEMTYINSQQPGSFPHMLVKEGRLQNRQLMQQQFFVRQQQLQEQHTRFHESLQAHPGTMVSFHSKVPSLDQIDRQSNWKFPLAVNFPQQGLHTHRLMDGEWKHHGPLTPDTCDVPSTSGVFDLSEATVLSQHANTCHYYARGFCGKGATSPFLHSRTGTEKVPQPVGVFMNGGLSAQPFHPERTSYCKVPRSGYGASLSASYNGKVKDALANGQPHTNMDHLSFQNKASTSHSVAKKSNTHEPLTKEIAKPVNMEHHALQQQHLKYSSLEDVEGHIFTVAKDQHGCRFLQRKFEEGGIEDVQRIFSEIIDHIIELMIDPFGNYLMQKLLEVCNESQLMEILQRVSGKGQLVFVSLNMHGTRAVQKLIESLKSPEQVGMVTSSLKQGTVTLIKDLNGNHVIQRCLQHLCNEDNQFIFDAATSHCVEIATHRHGCCVLQRCVDFASGSQRHDLVAEIASNVLVLSQDPFGNYIVQYILDLAMPWAIMDVITRLEGNFACLSMQKFSSNVVEKCLKLAGEENKATIIKELMKSSQLDQLLQDPYANYVVQCALTVSKGALHTSLIEVIKLHLPVLRSSPYGKRIISRTGMKNKLVL